MLEWNFTESGALTIGLQLNERYILMLWESVWEFILWFLSKLRPWFSSLTLYASMETTIFFSTYSVSPFRGVSFISLLTLHVSMKVTIFFSPYSVYFSRDYHLFLFWICMFQQRLPSFFQRLMFVSINKNQISLLSGAFTIQLHKRSWFSYLNVSRITVIILWFLLKVRPSFSLLTLYAWTETTIVFPNGFLCFSGDYHLFLHLLCMLQQRLQSFSPLCMFVRRLASFSPFTLYASTETTIFFSTYSVCINGDYHLFLHFICIYRDCHLFLYLLCMFQR